MRAFGRQRVAAAVAANCAGALTRRVLRLVSAILCAAALVYVIQSTGVRVERAGDGSQVTPWPPACSARGSRCCV
jgi:hypothetical protein